LRKLRQPKKKKPKFKLFTGYNLRCSDSPIPVPYPKCKRYSSNNSNPYYYFKNNDYYNQKDHF